MNDRNLPIRVIHGVKSYDWFRCVLDLRKYDLKGGNGSNDDRPEPNLIVKAQSINPDVSCRVSLLCLPQVDKSHSGGLEIGYVASGHRHAMHKSRCRDDCIPLHALP